MLKMFHWVQIVAFLIVSGAAFGDILVLPLMGPIDFTQACIIRRGLKRAQAAHYTQVILDIDTPGGRIDDMLDIIDSIQKVSIPVWAYVDTEAISAGSFIAACCEKIFFHPQGIMGAAAVIHGDGKDLEDTLHAKIDSYLWAKVRSFCEKYPYRYQWQRAMMDKNFVLKDGKQVIKPAGELLTLTAQEALKTYSKLPALSSGTFESYAELIQAMAPQPYKKFHLTGFEYLAQIFSPFIPFISGLGIFFLLLELKTPGFGLMGIIGISFLCLSFLVRYLAGLGGMEVLALFGFGFFCVILDLFVFGTIFIAFVGIGLILFGFWWSGIDIWPNIPLKLQDVLSSLTSLGYAFLWSFGLFFLAWKLGLFKKSLNRLTLSKRLMTDSNVRGINIGDIGKTITPLMPSGQAKIRDQVLDVRAASGEIDANETVVVIGKTDFDWMVKRLNPDET